MFLYEWLQGSNEWRNWGLNLATFSFLATIVLSLMQFATLLRQNQNIRKKRSGESVSVLMFAYFTVVYFCFSFYGLVTHSVGPAFNGLSGVFYLLVLISLWKFKGFTIKEKILLMVFTMMGLVEFFGPWKQEWMTVLMAGATVPLILQVVEVRRNKNVGSLTLSYFAVFAISTIFWTAFAFSTDIKPLKIVNPPLLVVLGILFYYWVKYKDNPSREQAR